MHQVKKVLKIILIVVVVLAALIGGGLFYMSRQPAAPDNYWTKIKTQLRSKPNTMLLVNIP